MVSVVSYYGISLGMVIKPNLIVKGIILYLFGSLSFAPYWRLLLLLLLFTLELSMIVTTANSFEWFLPSRTVFEKIQLARETFIIISIAMNQVGPFFFPVDNRTMRDKLLDLEKLLVRENECSKAKLAESVAPFVIEGKLHGLEKCF
jgi:hypothetical protein